MSSFTPATKSASRARLALCGPSGSGKTYTGLALAHGIGGKLAVVDTERGSASKYVGLNGWKFDTVVPESFSPDALSALLAEAGEEYDVILIDSLSHYWMGVDGMLEQADNRKHGSNSFSGWKEARPLERRMIDAMLAFPGHVIVTMRTKTEWVIEDDERGRKVPRKIGTKPEQREGIEYEFDLVGDMDLDNRLLVSKSRIPELTRASIPEPGVELAATILEWLSDGEDVPDATDMREQALALSDRAALVELASQVDRLGLSGAAVLDVDGKPNTLRQVIRNHWQRIGEPDVGVEVALSPDRSAEADQ